MGATKKKTSILTRYGRRQLAEHRFGTMRNFFDAAKPMLNGVVTTPQQLTRILSNEACTTEQAAMVENAVDYLLDRPDRIMQKIMDTAEKGKILHEIPVSDVVCLTHALRNDPTGK